MHCVMSNTAHVKADNILSHLQEEFAKNDHDYAVNHGGQITLQPKFAWSDRIFNSKDLLCSAGVHSSSVLG